MFYFIVGDENDGASDPNINKASSTHSNQHGYHNNRRVVFGSP